MNKPFVVIENEKVRFTDLGDGTTEIYFKDEDKKEIFSNTAIYQQLLILKANKPTGAYRHKGN